MLQLPHRGIYEYLWSEHKYSVLAISPKVFQGMAGKLGRCPQLLSWLRRLAILSGEERPELYNALLNAYMHIKPFLQRQQRYELIETLLNDQQAGAALIYQLARKYQEKSLYGCRLFFPLDQAIYKFWDSQYRPGLWLAFGAFQLHLSPEQVFARMAIRAGLSAKELADYLAALQSGISTNELQNWPAALRQQLLFNNLVPISGEQAFLHLRADFSDCRCNAPLVADLHTAAALVIERLWDTADFAGDIPGQLPESDNFITSFHAEFMPEIAWQNDFDGSTAWDFIADLFWQQKQVEAGQSESGSVGADSAGIGMQATDEEIDTEECEHGDEEACY